MANTVTYVSALTSAIDFLKSNDFNDSEVIAKLEKLQAQKATRSKSGKKSVAREENEVLAQKVVQTMRNNNVNEVRAGWVHENVNGINSTPKAVAVLNVAFDLGIVKTRTVAKSATRNEIVYYLPEN